MRFRASIVGATAALILAGCATQSQSTSSLPSIRNAGHVKSSTVYLYVTDPKVG